MGSQVLGCKTGTVAWEPAVIPVISSRTHHEAWEQQGWSGAEFLWELASVPTLLPSLWEMACQGEGHARPRRASSREIDSLWNLPPKRGPAVQITASKKVS